MVDYDSYRFTMNTMVQDVEHQRKFKLTDEECTFTIRFLDGVDDVNFFCRLERELLYAGRHPLGGYPDEATTSDEDWEAFYDRCAHFTTEDLLPFATYVDIRNVLDTPQLRIVGESEGV